MKASIQSALANRINAAAKISYRDFELIEDLIQRLKLSSYNFTDDIKSYVKRVDKRKPLGCKFSDLYHALHFNHNLDVFENANVLEIGGALPRAFTQKYLKAKSWTSIEKSGWNHDQGSFSDKSQQVNNPKYVPLKTFEHFSSPSPLQDYLIQRRRRGEIGKQFDVIYSIAAFEHIHDLDKTLDLAYTCLREGGILLAHFSDIWSSKRGHLGETIPHHIKDIYGCHAHLCLNPETMINALMDHSFYDARKARQTADYIYNDEGINRLLVEEYIQIFESSRFSSNYIELFGEIPFENLYCNNPDIVDLIQANYPAAYSSCEGMFFVFKIKFL